MDNNKRLENLKNLFDQEKDRINNIVLVNETRSKYLGKKSEFQEISMSMSSLSIEDKIELGKLLNDYKKYIENELNILLENVNKKEIEDRLNNDKIDITLPGLNIPYGSSHPLDKTKEEIEDIFISMGYDVLVGPDIEEDLYNFEMLNFPKGHPARDMQDTFYITDERLLRTHTSPVQVRTMLNNTNKTPIKMICPGSTYRNDNDDATHSHHFHQIEGMIIDENISMSDLKGTLELFVKRIFDSTREIRFRSSFFPFTEPSIEVDVSCFNCNKKGCNLCKNTGWIEILGAGMIHPNVLEMGGYDSKRYTGFAFGMGIERIVMLKYGITDIRYFYNNDLRFLKQFARIEGDSNEDK